MPRRQLLAKNLQRQLDLQQSGLALSQTVKNDSEVQTGNADGGMVRLELPQIRLQRQLDLLPRFPMLAQFAQDVGQVLTVDGH